MQFPFSTMSHTSFDSQMHMCILCFAIASLKAPCYKCSFIVYPILSLCYVSPLLCLASLSISSDFVRYIQYVCLIALVHSILFCYVIKTCHFFYYYFIFTICYRTVGLRVPHRQSTTFTRL
jgi:phosphotransferase system  glucose/maltose/N-acetylglucosamine-specific IIC component